MIRSNRRPGSTSGRKRKRGRDDDDDERRNDDPNGRRVKDPNVSLLLEQEKTETEEKRKEEGTTERSEEEEQRGEQENKNKVFTDEGVPIAFPDDYGGTSAIIITPDGITMHRTSRGAFKCGQCKYCVATVVERRSAYITTRRRKNG